MGSILLDLSNKVSCGLCHPYIRQPVVTGIHTLCRDVCVGLQVESGIAMQNLKPTIDNIKRLYGDDKKKIERETSALYKKANVSPLAGGQYCNLSCIAGLNEASLSSLRCSTSPSLHCEQQSKCSQPLLTAYACPECSPCLGHFQLLRARLACCFCCQVHTIQHSD